jgi:hypothetical protein
VESKVEGRGSRNVFSLEICFLSGVDLNIVGIGDGLDDSARGQWFRMTIEKESITPVVVVSGEGRGVPNVVIIEAPLLGTTDLESFGGMSDVDEADGFG